MKQPEHVGVYLGRILASYDISQRQFARAIGVSVSRVNNIVNGRYGITAEAACRICAYLGNTFWTPEELLREQAKYELSLVDRKSINREIKVRTQQ